MTDPSETGDTELPALFRRTLVLAPHADDEAFVAGLLFRVLHQGYTARVAVSAVGDNAQPHAGRVVRASERVAELEAAAHMGGWDLARVAFPGADARLDAVPLRRLVAWVEAEIRIFQPSAVLVPEPSAHQDHRAVYEAALAALRPQPGSPVRLVAVYEYPTSAMWRGPYPGRCEGRMLVDVSGSAMVSKREVLACYESQMAGCPVHHPLHPEGAVRLSSFRGMQAGVAFAEALRPLLILL